MILFSGTLSDRPFLGVGLSARNIDKLKQGLSILKPLTPLNSPDQDILIVYGDTEDEVMQQLQSQFSMTATAIIDERPLEESAAIERRVEVEGLLAQMPPHVRRPIEAFFGFVSQATLIEEDQAPASTPNL